MDMIKYIVKRLLLSILILFGVSVIIYSLARMMPTDYVDQQYSSAVAQGTMRQEDVDRIKELYGLAMPDAYLTVKVGEGSNFADKSFTKNTKEQNREDIRLYENEIARIQKELASEGITDENKETELKNLSEALAEAKKKYKECIS